MKIKHVFFAAFAVSFLSLSMISCKKDKVKTDDTPKVEVQEGTIYTSFAPEHYSFYSLSENGPVPVADSATSKWDFGVNFTQLIFNNGSSGPGEGGVIVQKGDFDAYTEGPTTGYKIDEEDNPAVNAQFGDPDAWYEYVQGSHGVTPKAGQFFLVKTGNGKYAKLDIYDSGYAGWDGLETSRPDTILYDFRFVYQPDGTANFDLTK